MRTAQDQLIERLAPGAEPFELELSETGDFILTVGPDGTKQWWVCLEGDAGYYRHALGVFPEMDTAAAYAAYQETKRLAAAASAPAGATPGHFGAASARAPGRGPGGWLERHWRPIGLSGLALLVATVAIGVGQRGLDNPGPAEDQTVSEGEASSSEPAGQSTEAGASDRLASPGDDVEPPPLPDHPIRRVWFADERRDGRPVNEIGPLVRYRPQPRTVYFVSELQGMAGHSVVHRWMHAGEERARYRFGPLAEPAPLLDSEQTLTEADLGRWVVEVRAAGEVLAKRPLNYLRPPAARGD